VVWFSWFICKANHEKTRT